MEAGMDSREAELQEAIRRFGEAGARGDAATLDALLSPTYTHTDNFGAVLDGACCLQYTACRAVPTTIIGFRDIETRIVGDVAVVTGINLVQGAGSRSADDNAALILRFTQVWVFRDGRWLREAFQATPINSKETAS